MKKISILLIFLVTICMTACGSIDTKTVDTIEVQVKIVGYLDAKIKHQDLPIEIVSNTNKKMISHFTVKESKNQIANKKTLVATFKDVSLTNGKNLKIMFNEKEYDVKLRSENVHNGVLTINAKTEGKFGTINKIVDFE